MTLTTCADKPHVAASAAAVATKRSQSQPKKSTEVDKADSTQRKNSDLEEEDKKEQKKSRSASRGIIERLKPKKDEKKEEKEEKKTETEISKPEDESMGEAAPVGAAAVAGVAGGAAVAEGVSCKWISVFTLENAHANLLQPKTRRMRPPSLL